MRKSAFGRVFALTTVIAMSGIALAAAPSNAALTLKLPGLLGSGPASPGPVTSATTVSGLLTQTTGALGSLLTNQIGLGTTAETVACPVAKTLAQLPPPGTPGVSESVFVACVLHFLDFEWRTTHPGPPAPLFDNNTVTTLGVPTPLNLDSDPLPEAVGIVMALAPNKFQLSFRRTDLGLKGDLPSTAELVITDPTGGALPRSHIGIGLDSNGGRFPDSLALTFTLESYNPPIDFSGPPRFRIDVNSTTQTQRAAITADLFDENATSTVRDSFVRADVGMKPVPSTLAAKVAMRTDDGIDADLFTASTQPLLSLPGLLNINYSVGPKVGPPTVDAKVAIREKADATGKRRIQRLSAKLTDLPSWMGLRYRPIKPSTPAGTAPEQLDKARGGQTVDYAASSTLNALEVSYDDVVKPAGTAPEKPSLRAHLLATSIPPGIGVSQLGSFTNFNAINDGIGKIEGEFAVNGELIQRRTDRPGVRFLRKKPPAAGEPQPLAIAARIDGLRRVAFDNLEGRMVGDVGIKQQPFDVDLRDDISGITAEANIEDLPADAKFQYLPAKPASDATAGGTPKPLRVRYDAGDHTIGLIKFKASFDQTVSDYLDQIEGRITDLPPVIDVTADLVGKVYEFNASKPFGVIEALARNKKAVADATVPELSDGVTGASGILKDDGTFAAKARVMGLKNVKADLGLNKYHVEAGAVPLEVRALVDEVRGSGASREVLPRELLGTIDRLPDRIDLSFDEEGDDQKVITYDASAGIGAISLQLTGPKLYAPQPKVNKVRATAFDVPSSFTARLGNAGKLDLDAGPGIGGIEALVTSGPDPAFAPDHHAAYVENGKNVVVKAKLLGFQHFKLDPDPVDVVLETARSLPLDVDAKLDLVSDPDETPESEAHLRVSNVPTKIAAHYERAGKIHYEANDGAPGGRIDFIRANGTIFETRGTDHLKRDVSAAIEGLPSKIDVALGLSDPDKKTVAYSANGPTDRVAAEVTGDKLYEGEERINKLTAEVKGIPATLAATLGKNGEIDIDGGAGIDEITALVTDGPNPALPAGKHAANIQYNGEGVHAKVQLLGFKRFTLDPDPLDVVFETAKPKALDVDANVDETRGTETLNRVGTLDISAVPAKVSVKMTEPSAGTKKIHYEASSKIDNIDVTLNGPKLYADQPKINRLEAHVAGLPSKLDAIIGSDTHIDLDADSGIDSIGALATSGPDPALAAGKHAAYAETGANVVAKAQLLGFKRFKLAPDPLDVTFETQTDHALHVDAKLDWDHNGTPELLGTADIENVPATMHVQAETDGSYSYDASSRISKVAIDASGLPSVPQLPAKIAHANVTINGVPKHVEGGYGNTGRIHYKGTDGAGNLSAVDAIDISAETASPPALPTGLAANNASYRQLGSKAAAHAHITGLREIDITPTPLDAFVDTNVLQELDVDAAADADSNGTDEKALTAKLRSNITRVHVKDELAAAGRQIIADTGTPLGKLDVNAKADNLPMGINTAVLHLEDLPEYVKVAFPSSTNVIDVDLLRRDASNNLVTDGRGLDLLELSVNGGSPRSTIVNRDGNTVASDGLYVDLDNSKITTAGLKLHGLRGATYGTSPNTKIGLDVAQSQAQPVALDAYLDAKKAIGHIDSIPENMLLELSPAADVPISYSADQRINEIKVDTNYTSDYGIPAAQVRVRDAPTQFKVCFRTDGARASCMPSNRFDAATDKIISAAYESDVTSTGTRPTIDLKGCLDDATCATGRLLNVNVKVARRIELEAGASATGPSVRRFDCFDGDIDITNIFSKIGCMFAFPATAVSDALDSAKVHAFVWFDTGAQNLDGTAGYSIPSPVSFLDQPIVLTLTAPTLNADKAFLEADLKAATITSPFTVGGSMSCTSGTRSLTIGSHFHQSLGSIDIDDTVRDIANGFVDAYNALVPDDDELGHVQDPLPLGSIDGPINFDLIGRLC